MCDAGLFHSIYGTEGFQGFTLPFDRRDDIRALIGDRAERLVWVFCVAGEMADLCLPRQYYAWHVSVYNLTQEMRV